MSDRTAQLSQPTNADAPKTPSANAWRINVFGVRHLSPTGAWHLRRYLDAVRPSVVLIEGLADAEELIPHLTKKGTKPPVAILAYTDALPVRTLVYPLAKYSPEYQALLWAKEHDARVEFIDLPSDVFLGLQEAEAEQWERLRQKLADDAAAAANDETEGDGDDSDDNTDGADGDADGDSDASASPDDGTPAGAGTPGQSGPERRASIYERVAARAGEPDYDTYWERRFEHNLMEDSYRQSALELGRALRDEHDPPRWRAENLVREAYMRRRIEEVLSGKVKPEKVVAVVGAFHAPVLSGEYPAMTDAELAKLRRRSSKLTLMPYSYFKLSTQSGYGAGNLAPAYFELMWDTLEQGDLAPLPARYLSRVVRHLRDEGTHRSTAEVIEGVRLASVLSALKDGSAPTLRDLRDAAVTLVGHGELASIAEALVRVDVGTAIGELPKGVVQTSIQQDFDREMSRLKLEKYKTTVKQELALDLRENRRVKSEEAAFLDLSRSAFFHRLRVLEIGFAQPQRSGQQSATWAENWVLRWAPEHEIALVEAVLLGETIELATGFKFKTLLEGCTSIDQAATVVRDTCQCGLMASMDLARQRLQLLSAESSDLRAVARACFELSQVTRYGDVRKFDPTPLFPLLEELFVQGALAVHAAANCDNATAQQLLHALDEMNQVSLELHDRVEEELWIDSLRKLADADNRNPILSGYACALLLERGLTENEALAREVSRRLSPGIPADLGAGWFEGLSKRNRYSLLARQPLWEQLGGYISSLDDEQFRRALVFLRRSFGGFSPQEKRQISENLAQYWGLNQDDVSEAISQPLTEKEEETLSELNDFNFDDL